VVKLFIPGSLRRGYIKDTHVENGSRYLQILNCIPTLPNRTKFDRFEVRVFADNNRTECVHCGKKKATPVILVQTKPTFQKRCFNCNDTGHIARDCPYDPICAYCKKGGHKKHDSDLYKVEQARRDYGKYAPEIIEGFQEQDV
jgi:hypothetical protein